jgi:transcriptional regulator with XRE-family HTH domain
MERIADRLRQARRNAGFETAEDFAARVRIDPAIYRGFEEGTRYMSPQLGYRLAQFLNIGWIDLLYGPEYTDELADYGWQGTAARRRPRHAMAHTVYSGGGPQQSGGLAVATAERHEATPPLAPEPVLTSHAFARAEAPPAPPTIAPNIGRDAVPVEELDTRLAGGAGIARASQHPLAEWSLPRDVIKLGTRSAQGNLKMLAVLGDEMEPTLRINDRVLVDTADTRPSPAGIFLVWDGVSLVLRRVELVMGCEPEMVRIAADNPHYQSVERRLAETLIQGRAVAKWSWL